MMMKRFLSYFLLFYLILSAPGATGAVDRKTSVFNDCPPQALQRLAVDSLEKEWFTHPIFMGEDWFTRVYLAFDYLCLHGKGDPNQAFTFPSVLSFKFDFVPDNYIMNHPISIFQRDPDLLKLKPDDAHGIAACIDYWDATHALGGQVIETRKGYKGTLMVFDHTGSKIWQKDYDNPLSYFALMGQMVQDWMNFRGQTVSPGLAAELTRPMTSHPETVEWFGEIFHVESGSQEEWGIYEKILQKDPTFGEVQYWYANQRSRRTEDQYWGHTALAKALLDHPVACALHKFEPIYCTNQALLDNYEKSLGYAEEIMPQDPKVEYSRLFYHRDSFSLQEVISITELAGKHRSYGPLLAELADQFQGRGIPDKSIPFYLSTLNSGYYQNAGRYDPGVQQIGHALWKLGYWEEAITLQTFGIRDCAQEQRPWFFYYNALNFRELFKPGEAADLFLQRYIEHSEMWSLLFAYMSLFEGGLTATVQEWEEDPVTKPIPHIAPFYAARKAIAQGRTDKALALLEFYEFRDEQLDPWLQLEVEIIRADALLLAEKKKAAARHALNAWYLFPRSRRSSYLVELAFADDELLLTRFAKTAAFIFPQEAYWEEMLSGMRAKKGEDEKTTKISRELKRLIQKEA